MIRRTPLVLATIGLLCGLPPCGAWADNDPELERTIRPLIDGHRGRVAVAVRQLEGGDAAFLHQADVPMPTASLIKFPVMIEAYRQAESGAVRLDAMIELADADKVPGSGILTTHFSSGTRLSLRDAIRLMIAFSDNTATNLVLRSIGLPATAATMESMGMPHTKIHAFVFRRESSIFPKRSEEFGLGSTTALDMITLLGRLHRKELGSPDACAAMLDHLLACDDRTKIARFVPRTVRFAHKTGAVTDVRTDAGILFLPAGPVAVCVLTCRNEDRRWDDSNAGEVLCGRIGEAVAARFGGGKTEAETTRVVREGGSGTVVEDLQRTLNARLEPSPRLAVDGEFGPATADAVRRFQRERAIAVSGAADAATWKALGPVVESDAPVPAPDLVNRETPPREPADAPGGPPLVTSRGWVVYDAGADHIVAEHDAEEPLEMASTTKIMTAHLVLRLAESDPGLLDEWVTFSETADATIGSTAGIRAGERVPMRELLYGLLLPSGNDAAVAIAEHVGGRMNADGSRAEADARVDSVARFVDAMNARAVELALKQTRFANPHGLPDPKHRTSPRDLARLTAEAMRSPLFREYVGTRQRGCEVLGPDEYRRHVVWRNTNRLLAIDGYDGVKTGTTDAAGACLVSSVRRGDRWLLCVVLGATSNDARYVDSRNLLRWALAQSP